MEVLLITASFLFKSPYTFNIKHNVTDYRLGQIISGNTTLYNFYVQPLLTF